jgi:hypothetical protein
MGTLLGKRELLQARGILAVARYSSVSTPGQSPDDDEVEHPGRGGRPAPLSPTRSLKCAYAPERFSNSLR